MTNLQRDLIVFEKTDDLLLLFLFRNGTAKLNGKKINNKQYFELCCNKHTHTVYPVLCTHMLLYYYEFPIIQCIFFHLVYSGFRLFTSTFNNIQLSSWSHFISPGDWQKWYSQKPPSPYLSNYPKHSAREIKITLQRAIKAC